MNDQVLKITAEMPTQEARALVQFFKLAGHGDCPRFTADSEKTFQILCAAEKLDGVP